jgi:anti-anti-sigma factor
MSEDMVVVELRAVPLDVHRRAEDQSLTLQRELALVHAADATGNAPARLLWLSDELSRRYAAFGDQPQSVLRTALAGDGSSVDLHYEVPAHAAEAAEELSAVLDEVDEFCVAGDLLTLVASPEAQAYRRWFLGEFVAQIRDGAPPTPWTPGRTRDVAGAGATGTASTGAIDGRGTVVVDDDLDLEGAARIRTELAAILDRGVVDLTIDLAGCDFIDSVGISLLLTTRNRLHDSGGTLVVANAHGQPRHTLKTTGLYDALVEGT